MTVRVVQKPVEKVISCIFSGIFPSHTRRNLRRLTVGFASRCSARNSGHKKEIPPARYLRRLSVSLLSPIALVRLRRKGPLLTQV